MDTTALAPMIQTLRDDFPILNEQVNGSPLVYFDNAATTQKPRQVLDAIAQYYAHDNANVHRGVHTLSQRATLAYEAARGKVARFINAPDTRECIFVRGATEGINLVAQAYVAPRLQPGEGILLTYLEHHSNIVPWQMVCKRTGAELHVAPVSADGQVSLEAFEELLSKNVKFVAITCASNALGIINPVKKMIEMAHAHGALVLLDAAQAAPHMLLDVQDLNCDFLAFSGHKMYGPTGIGVLWGRWELLADCAPWQGGGEMINTVSFEATDYALPPQRFEAGTPNIAGAIGLGAAIDYMAGLDLEALAAWEDYLLDYATRALRSIRGYNLIGVEGPKVPVLSFVHGTIHAHDIGTILDNEGIAIRSGHHCAMPLMDFLGVAATARISLAFYNTVEEIDTCMNALENVKELFA
ncbi:cysteine desulfurase [Legionella geestiana]|uniref:aminotransferase class V-fold PLP-dependent enzyme n=1 Tax=Legionella geestiana TaxID=45065 RepID=UPI001092C1D5|nr:cysteine desulfurase [Legionella geestiana]QDQ40489.1 cysteine desulfurase [Legionella geestiana]